MAAGGVEVTAFPATHSTTQVADSVAAVRSRRSAVAEAASTRAASSFQGSGSAGSSTQSARRPIAAVVALPSRPRAPITQA
jgi:metal-dependent amidase/aminoacylase/carboxypeptidase family protein